MLVLRYIGSMALDLKCMAQTQGPGTNAVARAVSLRGFLEASSATGLHRGSRLDVEQREGLAVGLS